MALLSLLRPVHWVKNVFVFAALVFSRQLAGPFEQVLTAVGLAVGAFVCFSLAASAIYIVNDIRDRKTDSIHPERRARPIASGRVSVRTAGIVGAACIVPALVGSFLLSPTLAGIILGYSVLMVLYSFGLKHVMILDCAIIAVGFCLRAVAGAVVIDVFISPWLVVCTFALTLFLAFSKRRGEIAQLQANSEAFRRTLGEYTPELLAHMLDVSSVLAVICFLMYAMDSETIERFGTNSLVYTSFIVLYCIFRFSALTQKGLYSDPVKLILRDRPFQIGVLVWVVLCVGIIYFN
ncbi:MAG TPA: decaprenyl-phosphate phosphoribosyltransferase [Sedimentisphaerales bacterium]|nr:decaprenyl-phosphate phosphoribosyltransferase [Sedimentisphaerales bacterium]